MFEMHYLLFYEVAEDYASRRAEFRDAHLEKAWGASARGELVLGGALENPVDGAVKRWHVREWMTVAGEDAAKPIRPHRGTAVKATAGESSNAWSEDSSCRDKDMGMILRMWKARSTVEKAGEYIQHARGRVFPALRAIAGHRGAYLLRRAVDGGVELVVLTLWESMEAVCKFAGLKPEKAVVEPEARAVLSDFDETVKHFEIVHRPD